jgi:hypothetical protein
MFKLHLSAQAGAINNPAPTTLLHQPQPQRVVRDVVKLPPVRDPYAELSKASERLSAGKSVFVSDAQAEKLEHA